MIKDAVVARSGDAYPSVVVSVEPRTFQRTISVGIVKKATAFLRYQLELSRQRDELASSYDADFGRSTGCRC